MQRKIAAIMAADVFGYSRLVAMDEEDALQRLLSYREIFADFISQGGGRIFNTAGDAVLAEFPSAVEAVRAAVDIQESIRTRNLSVSEERQMLFRIGITIGDVLERDGDLLGDGVNIAARLQALAHPGGICVSRNMHEQVSNKLAVSFRDIGLQTVKNIPSPIQAFLLSAGDKPVEPINKPIYKQRLMVSSMIVLTTACLIALLFLVKKNNSKHDNVAATVQQSSSDKIYGFTQQPLSTTPMGDTPLDLSAIPFVCDNCRAEIAAALSTGSNPTLALSDTGAYGFASGLPTEDLARERSMHECSTHRRGDGVCELYAANGIVVWPNSLPLPPHPWIDGKIKRTPFDVSKIGGDWQHRVNDMQTKYSGGVPHKAVAFGNEGRWFYQTGFSSEYEAAKAVLQLCADRVHATCRLVAVDDTFIVAPSSGPMAPPPP